MKKHQHSFSAFLALVVFVAEAGAIDFNEYKDVNNYATAYLKPLAKDLGALMGGGTFRSGSVLGFPGVNAEVQVVGLTSGESPLLKNQVFFMPYGMAAVGLPVIGAEVFARGFQYSGLTILGGGTKYALPIFPSVPAAPAPSIAAVASYHMMTFGSGTDQLTATGLSVSGVLSYGFPGVPIEPYLGAGMDMTSMTAKKGSVADIAVSETGTRLVGGLSLTIFPLIYVTGEAGLSNSVTSFSVRAGIKLP